MNHTYCWKSNRPISRLALAMLLASTICIAKGQAQTVVLDSPLTEWSSGQSDQVRFLGGRMGGTSASDAMGATPTIRLTDLRPGDIVSLQVTASADGSVYGSDVYTGNSCLATAVVHAGLLAPGEIGLVQVRIVPGEAAYKTTTRNGVTSRSWNSYPTSFTLQLIEKTQSSPKSLPSPTLRPDQLVLGNSFDIELVGSTEGVVWGNDVYTSDSNLAAAAVHAGILTDGQSGTVSITVVPSPISYTGSTRNGVTSQPYGDWQMALVLRPKAVVQLTLR
jgi:LCCL domain